MVRERRLLGYVFAITGLNAVALAIAHFLPTATVPALALRPIIHVRDEERYEAMKSAPEIIVGKITNLRVVGFAPKVPKPPDVGGPFTTTIPMYLVQAWANVLTTLRGEAHNTVEFYFWAYALGTHGGSRLFDPSPGTNHLLFLRVDAGYLRMAGDYPAYDLQISSLVLPRFISEWNANTENESDLFERFITAMLEATLETISHEGQYWQRNMHDWMGLTSPFFVARKLDSYCRKLPNRLGQIAACVSTAKQFPGRCEAYRHARELGFTETKLPFWLDACRRYAAERIRELQQEKWPLYLAFGWSEAPERRRLAMRLYASATDAEFHKAACDAAATMPESRDIPECARRPRR